MADGEKKTPGETPENTPNKEVAELQFGIMTRRALIAGLFATAILLPLGLEKDISEFRERSEIAEMQKKWANERNERGELVYVYDRVTNNYFKRDSYVLKYINQLDKENPKQRILVRAVDCRGNPMVDVNYRNVELAKVVAEKLREADRLYYEANGGKEHIQIRMSFRPNWVQDQIREAMTTENLKKGKDSTPAAPVGNSFHEAGLAVDVVNWAPVQKYLVMAGLPGGFYTDANTTIKHTKSDGTVVNKTVKFRNNDANHFSMGELVPDIAVDKDGSVDWDDELTLMKRLAEFAIYNRETPSYSYMDQKGWVDTAVKTYNAGKGAAKKIWNDIWK